MRLMMAMRRMTNGDNTTNTTIMNDMPPPPQNDTITASLRFLADKESAAVYVASVGGVGKEVPAHEGKYVNVNVDIHNGRRTCTEISLDTEGFLFVQDAITSVEDFYNDEQVTTIYEKEVNKLVMNACPGAKHVQVFDYTRRSSCPTIRESHKTREPSATVHNDYTDTSGPKRLQELYPKLGGGDEQHRFAIVNVWKSIHGTVQQSPLAVCNASTVNTEHDLVSVKRQSKDRIGEIQMAVFNNSQEWYWFPQMTTTEVLLIKTYDSCTDDGMARFTIHTAFDPPSVPVDAPPRESIEARCFVFY